MGQPRGTNELGFAKPDSLAPANTLRGAEEPSETAWLPDHDYGFTSYQKSYLSMEPYETY